MAKITILGTGDAFVTHCYNTCYTIETDKGMMLVDAGGGNGILAQFEKSKIDLSKIQDMFVTHAHTDHILGTIWVIRRVMMLMNSPVFRRIILNKALSVKGLRLKFFLN